MIKGVIFDLDGTLYDYQACDMIARKQLAADAQKMLKMPGEQFLDIYDQARIEVKTRLGGANGVAGQHSRLLFCQKALEMLGISPMPMAIWLCDVSYWGSFLEVIQPYPSVIPFLKELKYKDISTAICTDMTSPIQYKKIMKLGFAGMIDHIITSEEVGSEKPSPKMFATAQSKLQLKKSEIMFIGDALGKDVEGSASYGFTPVWYRQNISSTEECQYLQINSYDDKRLHTLLGL